MEGNNDRPHCHINPQISTNAAQTFPLGRIRRKVSFVQALRSVVLVHIGYGEFGRCSFKEGCAS